VTDTYCQNSAWSNQVTIIRSVLTPLDGGTINYLASSMVCPDEEITFDDIVPASGGLSNSNGGSETYQWELSTDNGVNFTAITGATEEFYTTTDTASGTYVYRRKVTDYCNNTAYTNSITIIRQALEPLNGGTITYEDPTTVCYGDVIDFGNVTAASGGLTNPVNGGSVAYQWELSIDEGANFAPITGATEEFYTTTETGLGTFI